MHYDFDRVIQRRNTGSSKWDRLEAMFGRDDLLPLWVADTDFPVPEPVVRAIKERAEHPIYGYTYPSESLRAAIVDWSRRHYGWQIEPDWIVFTAGVINGLYTAIQAFTRPGDEIIVQPPVYYPFFNTIKNSGRQVVYNPLRLENGRYTMDFAGLEKLFVGRDTFPVYQPRIKLLVLCSPHNPVGRVWTREELSRLAEICRQHNVLLISDEIHCDLLFHDARHTVTATLSEEVAQRTITFMAGTKTFNLAGLTTSYAIIPNPRLRQLFLEARTGSTDGNLFGWVALEAAYRYGDDYLAQLREYLNANLDFFMDFIASRLPELQVIRPEGTYLCWVDMRGLGLDHLELQDFLRNEARLALDDGFAFGPGGEGFQRFNLGCPRSTLAEALERLEAAVRKLRSR